MTRAPRFDRQLLWITAAYTAAWGLMLLNGGLYWDDWCMVGLSTQGAQKMGAMAGQFWQPYYWIMLDRLPMGWYVGHALTFLLFLASFVTLRRAETNT